MEEVWKDVKGYEGLYQVSNLGRIKCLPVIVRDSYNPFIKKERIKDGTINLKGYYVVSLTKKGKQSTKTIHRLVADAFLPNPENKPCVDHIDTVKTNNKVDNLRWCTFKENSNNVITYEKLSSINQKNKKSGGDNKLAKPVYRFNLDKELIGIYPSTLEAAEAVGVKRYQIQACIYGTQVVCADSLWSLSDVYETTDYRNNYINKLKKWRFKEQLSK